MKVQATLNNLRITPRKVRLITHALVGVDARAALIQLSKLIKKSSRPIHDLLKSAVANATNNNGIDETNLYIFEIRVGDGLKLKRWLPRAFGRATPLLRRGSNVTIILEEKMEGKNRVVKKKAAVVATSPVSSEAASEKAESVTHKPIQPSLKREIQKGVKPTTGKVVKKVFQRKSV